MRARESLDERVVGARVVGNGFDEPTVASSYETSTRPAAARANAPVRGAQSPISGALPAPLAQQAQRFLHFFFLLQPPDTGEPGMGHHRQRDVPVPTVPETYFVLIQSCLALGLLDALLDRIAARCDPNLRLQ
jgi:hypothetical protein